MKFQLRTTNTILYCRNWADTVAFYRDVLALPVLMRSDWFIEFQLTETARISVADETRASVKCACGQGITLAFEVTELEEIHRHLETAGAGPTPLREHPWEARVFYLRDPEGNRIEFWEKSR